MARTARIVLPGVWHHITQRGNQQQTVFFTPSDYELYLGLLRRHCSRHAVRIGGYCLLSNHVHLVATPQGESGLANALGRTHVDYARWLNLRHQTTGHLWQNRFYSCPLDEHHHWEALRYVELNPVRAGLVDHAEDWRWSSVSAHLTGADPAGLIDDTEWRHRWTPAAWREALELGIGDAALLERIREATRTGRPAGSDDFLKCAETASGRFLRPCKRGPKPRATYNATQLNLGIS